MSFNPLEHEAAFKAYRELGVDLSKFKSEAFVDTIVDYEALGYEEVINLRRKLISEHEELFHKACDIAVMRLKAASANINSFTPPSFKEIEPFSLKMVQYGETIGLFVNVIQLLQVINNKGLATRAWYLSPDERNMVMLNLLLDAGFDVTLQDIENTASALPTSSELAMACNLLWRIFAIHAVDLSYALQGAKYDEGCISLYKNEHAESFYSIPCATEWANFVRKFKASIVNELNPSMDVDEFELYLEWT